MGDLARWFDTSAGMWPVTTGNAVDFFITGEAAFGDMAERLQFDVGKGALFFLLGWSCDVDVKIAPAVPPAPAGPAGETLKSHVEWFANKGGRVFAMIWKNTIFESAQTKAAVTFINGLPSSAGHAVLDSRTPLAGSHHQKVQIVVAPTTEEEKDKVSGVGVAYCGGMDFASNRVGGAALHDVHCKLRGGSTKHFVDIVRERWADHPDATSSIPKLVEGTAPIGACSVQVCRTYPAFQNPGLTSLFSNQLLDSVNKALSDIKRPTAGDMRVNGSVRLPTFYPATTGVQQVWRAIRKAINTAERFIYVEDQYFTHKWVGDALARKLTSANDDFRLVLLLLSPDAMDVEQAWQRRRLALQALTKADPGRKRWTAVQRDPGKPFSYVHSKTWIFDDELVITGSANADRRGFTYNSEVDVVVGGAYEQKFSDVPSIGAKTVAQDLRCRLFAKHLGDKPATYLDPKKAIAAFFGKLGSTNVAPFNPAAKPGDPDKVLADLRAKGLGGLLDLAPGGAEEFLWNNLHDPDSAVPEPP